MSLLSSQTLPMTIGSPVSPVRMIATCSPPELMFEQKEQYAGKGCDSIVSGTTSVSTQSSTAKMSSMDVAQPGTALQSDVSKDLAMKPDFSHVLFCIACILQSTIFDDTFKTAERRMKQPGAGALHREFEMFTLLPCHLGGLQHPSTILPDILAKETQNDPELLEKILAGEVPTVDTILRFLAWLHESAAYSSECNIMAFIYLKRLMAAGTIELTATNWRGLWVGAITVAQKMWDDTPLRTSSFSKVLPGVCKIQLRDMEMRVFKLLDYCANVQPAEYAEHYFELREIFKCLVGGAPQQQQPQAQQQQLPTPVSPVSSASEATSVASSFGSVTNVLPPPLPHPGQQFAAAPMTVYAAPQQPPMQQHQQHVYVVPAGAPAHGSVYMLQPQHQQQQMYIAQQHPHMVPPPQYHHQQYGIAAAAPVWTHNAITGIPY